MRSSPPDLLLTGQVVVSARPNGLDTAEAIAIGDGRVLATGSRAEIIDLAGPGTRVLRFDDAAIVPGMHDFHLHLVGMARARRIVDLSSARTMDAILGAMAVATRAAGPDDWVRGDGWRTEALDRSQLHRLEAVLAGRPAFLKSHDRHSAWASRAGLARAGISQATPDPPGGRFERGTDGELDGVLRERASDLVADRVGRLTGPLLTEALVEVARGLSSLGITGVTDAGDPTNRNGRGRFASLGDSFSSLVEAESALAGLLGVTVGLPVAALPAAAGLELRFGTVLGPTMQVGWAKVYLDGALGSRTAALLEPYRCAGAGDDAGTGIVRVPPDELAAYLQQGREAGIGLAIHAIGDAAVGAALDGVERAGPRQTGVPPDRVEHAQLVRPADLSRFVTLDVTASLQPIHLPSDRDTADECWSDRLGNAYAWRSIGDKGVRIALGSDAPIETANPWLGIFAAVRRHAAGDRRPSWRAAEAMEPAAALSAYTLSPALAAGASDLGHLRRGARADLAVLSIDLPTLLAADEELAAATSQLTLLKGTEVHPSIARK
jgi:predicted amidohydrolase YtcJ